MAFSKRWSRALNLSILDVMLGKEHTGTVGSVSPLAVAAALDETVLIKGDSGLL